MIIAADLHLREDTEEVIFNEVLPGIFGASGASGEDGDIAILGDVFHIRYKVDARLFNRFRDVLLGWVKNRRVHLLPGNHDQYDLAGRNVLEPLGSIPGVEVYSSPTVNGFGTWIPYRKSLEEAAQMLARHPGGPLFIHQGVRGAVMNDMQGHVPMVDRDGVEIDSRFSCVFCGHYHKHHEVTARVRYVGSPYQTRASESGNENGYISFDRHSLVWKFQPQNWGPRYHNLKADAAGFARALSGLRPEDVVRVSAAAGMDAKAITEQLVAAGLQNYVVTGETPEALDRLCVADGATLASWAQAYVTQEHGVLDPDRLMRVFEKIMGAP